MNENESRLTNDEYDLLMAMQKYGGGFASALAQAWLLADLNNKRKLRNEFRELLESYRPFLKGAA